MLVERALGAMAIAMTAATLYLANDERDEAFGIPTDLPVSAHIRVALIPIVFILVGGFFRWVPTLNTRKKGDPLRHFCLGIDLLVAALIAQLLYMTDDDHESSAVQDALAFFLLTFLALLGVTALHIKLEHDLKRKRLRALLLLGVGNFLGFVAVVSFALIVEI